MNKELEALENIGLWGYQNREGDLILCRINNKEDFAIIENALKENIELKKENLVLSVKEKALEIIKSNIYEVDANNGLLLIKIPKPHSNEYDLLKEVLL